MSTADRPPFVAWTLRILLCATDSRTKDGELTRLLDRAAEDLTTEEATVVAQTAHACLSEIRRGRSLATMATLNVAGEQRGPQ